MRAKAIARYNLPSLEFSQAYSFFWDQLEKSNLFLQGVIDTAKEPMSNQTVEWLFKHPLSDGGTFTGVADIVSKYGLVPKEVMPETYSSEHTSQMSSLIGLKLKEYGLELRESVQKGMDVKKIEARKTEMLETVYRILVLNLGVPPTEFDYVRKDVKGNPVETEHHTPMSFLEKYGDKNLLTNYVMVMNDPSREYYKCYEIDFDRHCYDGKNWTYVNLPVEEIKEMAIASLKDSTRMYFSSDVTQLDSKRGLLDVNNYDFGSLLGTTFGMDKKQRIQTFASMSAHAMTLMAVDLDENGKPIDIKPYEKSIATNMIEEFMLVCNETIAENSFWQEMPFMYRSHQEPDEDKLEKMEQFLRGFGYYLRKKDGEIHPRELQKVLQKAEETDEERIITRMVLRSMMQARYTAENGGHFGLAAKYYCHFTSPIRRYPDLEIHRMIKKNASWRAG